MEGFPHVTGPSSDHLQIPESSLEDIIVVEDESLPYVYEKHVQNPEKDTKTEITAEQNEMNQYELNTAEVEKDFILDEQAIITEHSKLGTSTMNTEKTAAFIASESNTYRDDSLQVPEKPPGSFTCHTNSMGPVYWMWQGSKYCYSAADPIWDTKRSIKEELFDDCLNYLECSDVMNDYTIGIWQQALSGNDPLYLLESDQVDETKVNYDYLNGCDPFPSGVTCVNEVSDNTLATDAFTGQCVSHSESSEVAVKRELSRESLESLQTEMVITVGHQQDEMSSEKNKERCKLHFSAAAIQDDRAGIEDENNIRGQVSIHGNESLCKAFVELFPVNRSESSVKRKGLNTMTDEPMASSVIKECSKESNGNEQISALFDKNYLEISPEQLQEKELNEDYMNTVSDISTDGTGGTQAMCEEEIRGDAYKETPQCLEALSSLLEEQVDTTCNCTMECPAGGNSKENATVTLIKCHKPNEVLPETCGQSSEHFIKVRCESKQPKDCQQNTNHTKEKKTKVDKMVCSCPTQQSKNKQKAAHSPSTVEHLSNTETIDHFHDGKDLVGVNISPGQRSDEKCKIFDNMEIGYNLPGILCDKSISDSKCQKGNRILSQKHTNIENGSDERSQGMDGLSKQTGEVINTNTTIQLDNVRGQVTDKHTLMAVKKNSVLNDKDTNLDTCKEAKSLGLHKNSTSDDHGMRTIDTQQCRSNGTNINNKALAHHPKGELKCKNKDKQHSSQNNRCATASKCDQLDDNIALEDHQNDIANEHLSNFSVQSEALSPRKVKAELPAASSNSEHNNLIEIDTARPLNTLDYIPSSQGLLYICEDSEANNGDDLNLKSDCIQNLQSPAHTDPDEGKKMSLSESSVATVNGKNTDETAMKKGKTKGTEAVKNVKCIEKGTLVVNEALPLDEPNESKQEDKTEVSAAITYGKKAPRLLHHIEAEMFPDRSGNLKLYCHFGEIHADSTVTWTKDSKLLARIHRSSNDESPVSLAIVQTSKKDQGVYLCSLKNMYGKVSAEFHLTSEVLEQLFRYQDVEGGEDIEFNQLLFRDDFITDMYFGGNLHGRIATEDLHFGEGVHRKAFRSKVMCGLFPVFNPGHLCVLKVHNAIAYGTKNSDELVQRNYKLAVQECYVQNTAREYAKIYAAEAEQLEEFGEVPEIIPVFLIHRPANNIPYATVEEELIGDFVKYSVRDGKEINVLRRDSEAGQKCCTFQHWVYEKTNGNLLVTDMQGVGMKLTDVGIATLAKGYKGFKGNCSVSFIDQFKALHLCNKYCEILGLKSLRTNHQKQKKPSAAKERTQQNPLTSKKPKNSTKTKNKT